MSGFSDLLCSHLTVSSFPLLVISAYPVVWALCEGTGRLSADTEVLLFGILDVIAKPVWGLWIVLAIPSVRLPGLLQR